MRLEGIHHVSAITADAARNVRFYADVLGLRLVKRTVNQDDPTVWHLFYADEQGSPGADVTFFEYPGMQQGRAGDGMVHTIAWRVATPTALGFWQERLEERGVLAERSDEIVRFHDPDGLAIELRVAPPGDEPLVAKHPEIPVEMALQGFDGVRAYSSSPQESAELLADALRFERLDGAGRAWQARGDVRGARYDYDDPPYEPGMSGAGTVHHVAWACTSQEQQTWRNRVSQRGMMATPVIDRFYFRSVYFREPSGVLFELATIGPGFTVDEPADSLGERLSLPPAYDVLRDRIVKVLTPLPVPLRQSSPSRLAQLSPWASE